MSGPSYRSNIEVLHLNINIFHLERCSTISAHGGHDEIKFKISNPLSIADSSDIENISQRGFAPEVGSQKFRRM
jgi:hypothetical protein